MNECPVCYVIGSNDQFVRCGNGHVACNDCFPRIQACPMCRDSLRNFTDSNGLAAYIDCPNCYVGCNAAIPRGGNHTCRLELLAQLNKDQRSIIGHILTTFTMFETPLFIWNLKANRLMKEMFDHYLQNPEVWERYFGGADSDVLSAVIAIIKK